MKNITKTAFSCLAFCMIALSAFGQYCVPVVDVANGGGMGITIVSAANLNRTSVATEGFIYTGDSIIVAQGDTVSITVATEIGDSCPNNHIRVYIDMNADQDFEDAGEEVVTLDNQVAGTFTEDVPIPVATTTGIRRMRVMNKMIESCGHDPIDPCGLDSNAYHGEVEDYLFFVNVKPGIEDLKAPAGYLSAWQMSNGFIAVKYKAAAGIPVTLSATDLSGKTLFSQQEVSATGGDVSCMFQIGGEANRQMHLLLIRIESEGFSTSRKLLLF